MDFVPFEAIRGIIWLLLSFPLFCLNCLLADLVAFYLVPVGFISCIDPFMRNLV